EDWYGMLYSWADNKKRSTLMMSLFEPGDNALPWLGKFKRLGPAGSLPIDPYGEDDSKTPFPLTPGIKKSYGTNPVVWIKPSGLQADVQKVLRYARKLPEKTQIFYKELNRLRKAALSFGMIELLQGLSRIMDRECQMLPGTAHPDAALQLTHASKALRMAIDRGISYEIVPLSTNFAKNT
ncbi:integrator complex subunit 14-like, partial [Anneissia japonica]|uniref:integrator complex subunit 14-like n=1 Tax=Anneissia japonica TaxID=1529436 RepID=UPI0014259CFD